MQMRLLTLMSFIVLSLFLCVSCGGSDEKCDDGYTWNSNTGECEKDSGGVDDRDTYHPPVDKDTAQPDEAPDEDVMDEDSAADADIPYTGECAHADASGVINIDVKQRTLTIGTVTSDITLGSTPVGELWGEHTYTRSMFKIADVDASLAGKTFEIPMDSYRLYYRHILADGKTSDTGVQIGDTLDMNKDKTLDIVLPLVHITGSVTKNGAGFPVLTGTNADETSIVLSNDALTFTIPYADFGGYALDIPTGTYALYFEGRFSDASPAFEGGVLPQDSGIEVSASGEVNIDIPTITTSGSASIDGALVDKGSLVLITNPPFGAISGTLVSDLSASTSYSIEMLGGAHTDYTVVYLPSVDDYPGNWVKIEQWTGFAATGTHNVSLDFGKLFGTLSYKGGEFPALTECEATEATCTRGKLKLLSFDGSSSITLNNLGASGSDYAYEALVVRRIASEDPMDPTKIIYTPRKYSLAFESFYNDINGIYDKIPFLAEAKYLNSDSVLTSTVDFQKADESYLTQREIDINIAPKAVSGTISFNGKAISCDKDEYIYAVNNVTKDEVPIINLKTLTDTSFAVQMPEGTYTLVYDGECLLKNRHKVPVLRDLSISDTVTGADIAMQTSRFFLAHTINGTPYKEWVKAHPEVKSVQFTVGTDGSALRWKLTEKMEGDTPTVAVFNGEDWDLSMSVITGEGEEASEAVFPLYSIKNMKADVTVESDIPAVPFTTQLTVDGKPMKDATEWRGKLEFGSESFYLIKYPHKGATTAKGFALPGEYKVPTPTVYLNDGFDAKEKLRLECIFID